MSKIHYVGKVGQDIAGHLILTNPQVAYCGLGVVQIDVTTDQGLPVLVGGYVLTDHAIDGDVYYPPALQVGAVSYPLSIEDDDAALYRVWSVIRRAWHLGAGHGYTTTLAETRALTIGEALRLIAAIRDGGDPIHVTVPTTITR